MIKIEFKEAQIKCIRNFYALDGTLIFEEGCTYPVENNVILKGRYNLHWNDKLLMHFRFN
jgi:hypothetical protein